MQIAMVQISMLYTEMCSRVCVDGSKCAVELGHTACEGTNPTGQGEARP